MSELPEFMDDLLLGLDDGPPFAADGACEAFVQRFPDPRHGVQLIATYFWWSLWHSLGDHMHGRVIGEVLRKGFDHEISDRAESVVVAHAGVSRFSLLLLDPSYLGEPASVALRPDRRERFVQIRGRIRELARARPEVVTDQRPPLQRVSVAPRLVEQAVRYEFGRATGIQDTGAARNWELSASMVLAALDEFCRGTEFGVVLARGGTPVPPDDVPPAAGLPRPAVGDDYPPMSASIPMLYNPRPATAEKAASATYLGRTSGVTRTWIRGYGPDVVHARPAATTTSIFTSPEMAPGDEDSSLVDRDGLTVGVGDRRVEVQLEALTDEPAPEQDRDRPVIATDAWNWVVQVLADDARR